MSEKATYAKIAQVAANGKTRQMNIRKRIDDNALVALALMIAASKPSEKEIMAKVILNLLNEKQGR